MNLKRVGAWILLILFVLLVANILFIGFYATASAYVYVVIALVFLFGHKKLFSYQEPVDQELGPDEENGEENKIEDDV